MGTRNIVTFTDLTKVAISAKEMTPGQIGTFAGRFVMRLEKPGWLGNEDSATWPLLVVLDDGTVYTADVKGIVPLSAGASINLEVVD